MLKLTLIGTAFTTFVAAVAYRLLHAYHVIDNEEEINEKKYLNNRNILSIKSARAKKIGNSAFSRCKSLRKADFPNVTRICIFAFGECISLEVASFPIATSIDPFAFLSCSRLKTAYLPFLKNVNVCLFSGCDNLKVVVLPDILFDEDVINDEWKTRISIREEAQCIRHSDYLNIIKEINHLIREERFKAGDDKILELLLLKKIQEDKNALPGVLSTDEKKLLMDLFAADVYTIVTSIQDCERKEQWASFLGLTPRKDCLSQIIARNRPHQFLNLKDLQALRGTSRLRGDNVGRPLSLPKQHNGEKEPGEAEDNDVTQLKP